MNTYRLDKPVTITISLGELYTMHSALVTEARRLRRQRMPYLAADADRVQQFVSDEIDRHPDNSMLAETLGIEA